MTEKELTLYLCKGEQQKQVREVADAMEQLMNEAGPGVGVMALALVEAETELALENSK